MRDLWETDPGLNSGAELLAFDWTGCTGLTEREQEGVMETLGAELGLDTRRGTLEELAEEGLIRADPDSGFEEFPAGCCSPWRTASRRTGDTPFRSRNTAPAWGPTVSMIAPPGRRGTAGAMSWGRR